MSLAPSRPLSVFLTRDKLKFYLISRSKLLLILLIIFSITGYFGEVYLYLDLVSHFKAQYLILTLLCFFLFAFYRLKLWTVLGFIAVSINAFAVLPFYLPTSTEDSAALKSNLTLMLSNVYTSNTDHSKLIKLVQRVKPDILVAQEVNRAWSQSLDVLKNVYPYRKVYPRSDNFGIAIYSRLPFVGIEIIELGRSEVPSIVAKVIVSGKEVHILSTHPVPPIDKTYFSERNTQLSSVASYIRKISNPKIVVGDLNTSMWSPFYSRFARESGLVNCRDGQGILPTWPTNIPFFMMPLDHCLVSSDIRVNNIKTGDDIGSDHLPLLMELSI